MNQDDYQVVKLQKDVTTPYYLSGMQNIAPKAVAASFHATKC